MSDDTPPTTGPVLVTGATGFVAGHVIADLLAHGRDVRATVRDPATAEVGHLREAAALAGRELHVVAASLDDDAGWDAAAEGAAGVIHVASPVPARRPKRLEDVTGPAVDGTRRVLAAAGRQGVRRVVMTSSIDAIRGGHDARDGRVRGPEDWARVERAGAYAASKTLAERAAWELAAETGPELVTLQPGLILGPTLTTRTAGSVDMVLRLLNGEFPALPHLGFAVTDVRDIAAAHRRSLDTPGAAGRRLPVVGHPLWLAEIADEVRRAAPELAERVPRRRMPSPLVRLLARFDASLDMAVPLLDRPVRISSDAAEQAIGWKPRPAAETIADTVRALVGLGLVKPNDRAGAAPRGG
ncbi:MAG TPA: NAD-dependent epimerase/dehydratase family protein [Pseudonocardiaceae bacterium]